MKIMGVDPGTLVTGYGIIEDGHKPMAVEHDTLRMNANDAIENRLHQLHTQIMEVITRHTPDVVAVETPFIGKSPKSSLAIGQAQAIVLLSAASQGITIRKYTPASVKQALTNDGRANKEQVRMMVAAELHIPDLTETDASDALAVALCHVGKERERILLNEAHAEPKNGGNRRRTKPSGRR